jgi:hypothetical protein
VTTFVPVELPLARNAAGFLALMSLERLPPLLRRRARERLWSRHVYVYVTPPRRLVRQALEGYPREVKKLARTVRFFRSDDRGGGGYWPERNEIWLAAGVETYERYMQARASARHELFHHLARAHPFYRADEDDGWPRLVAALEDAKRVARDHERYAAWVERSFLPQRDHANVVEFFADIPTNFPDLRELPPPLAAHFGPLIDGGPLPAGTRRGQTDARDLAAFQRLIAPG